MSDARPYLHRVHAGDARGPLASLLRGAAQLAAPAYATVNRARNTLYDRGTLAARAALPVVSVGNLTVGGTGKTPTVMWLARALIERGHRPAVLLRGYKAGPAGSDEERLYRAALPTTPVVAEADRVAAVDALARGPHPPTVVLLDDGFQHRRLARAFDLVLLDATDPWGGGRTLPAGRLREPVEGLRRADAVLLTRCDLADADADALEAEAKRVADVPVWRSRQVPADPVDAAGQPFASADPFAAFCGIGNPAAFFAQCRELAGPLVMTRAFADHHAFTAAELDQLARDARAAGARWLLTTEKDAVRLPPGDVGGLPVARRPIATVVEDGDALVDRIARALSAPRCHRPHAP